MLTPAAHRRSSRKSAALSRTSFTPFTARHRKRTSRFRSSHVASSGVNLGRFWDIMSRVFTVFSVFTFLRGLYDSIIVGILIWFATHADFEMVRFVPPPGAPSVVIPRGLNYTARLDEEEQEFNAYQKVVEGFLIFQFFVVFAEVPLTWMRYRATKKDNEVRMNQWIRLSLAIILFNFLSNCITLSYCRKMGLIRDDIWITDHGDFRIAMYSYLFRVAMFDLTKASEMVCVYAYMKELRGGETNMRWRSQDIYRP